MNHEYQTKERAHLEQKRVDRESAIIHMKWEKYSIVHTRYEMENENWHDFDDFHLQREKNPFFSVSSKWSEWKAIKDVKIKIQKTDLSYIFASYLHSFWRTDNQQRTERRM